MGEMSVGAHQYAKGVRFEFERGASVRNIDRAAAFVG